MSNASEEIKARVHGKMTYTTSQLNEIRDTLTGLWGMSRPIILVSNILVWLLGVAIAFGKGYTIELNRVALSFVAFIIMSASVHYTNEYADYETRARIKEGVDMRELISREDFEAMNSLDELMEKLQSKLGTT